jgi:coatomer protein complex subunit gamma
MEGPKTPNPTKYIRYIYNRVVLENALVRAAAVTALAKFGVGQQNPEVKHSVHVLLTRCLDDVDDEVRDRAALSLRLMDEDDEMANKFVRNGKSLFSSITSQARLIVTDSMFSLPVLEHQLVMYVTSEGRDTFSKPFDLSSVPVVTREQAHAEERTKKLTTATPTLKAPTTGPKRPIKDSSADIAAATATAQKHAAALAAVPEIAAYGTVLKSSRVIELTESETEYVVTAIKHIFKDAIVLQFDIKNTLPSTVLTDVSMVAAPADSESGEPQLEEDFTVPIPRLDTDVPGTGYVAFKRVDESASVLTTTFTNILKFTSKEIDPSTGEPEESGYEDEYQVEDLDLTGADFISPAYVGNFDTVWEQVAGGDEASETLQLANMKSIAGMYSDHHFLILSHF